MRVTLQVAGMREIVQEVSTSSIEAEVNLGALCSVSHQEIAVWFEKAHAIGRPTAFLQSKENPRDICVLSAWWEQLMERLDKLDYQGKLEDEMRGFQLIIYFPDLNRWIQSSLPVQEWGALQALSKITKESSPSHELMRYLLTPVSKSCPDQEQLVWFKNFSQLYFGLQSPCWYVLSQAKTMDDFRNLLQGLLQDPNAAALLAWMLYDGIGGFMVSTELAKKLVDMAPNHCFLVELIRGKMILRGGHSPTEIVNYIGRIGGSNETVLKIICIAILLHPNIFSLKYGQQQTFIQDLLAIARREHSPFAHMQVIAALIRRFQPDAEVRDLHQQLQKNVFELLRETEEGIRGGSISYGFLDLIIETVNINQYNLFNQQNVTVDFKQHLERLIRILNYSIALGSHKAILEKVDAMLLFSRQVSSYYLTQINHFLAALPDKEKSSPRYFYLMGRYHLQVAKNQQMAVNSLRQAIKKGSDEAAWTLYQAIRDGDLMEKKVRDLPSLMTQELVLLFQAGRSLPQARVELVPYFRKHSNLSGPMAELALRYRGFFFSNVEERMFLDKIAPIFHQKLALECFKDVGGTPYSYPISDAKQVIPIAYEVLCPLSHKKIEELTAEADKRDQIHFFVVVRLKDRENSWLYSGPEYLMHLQHRVRTRALVGEIESEDFYLYAPGSQDLTLVGRYQADGQDCLEREELEKLMSLNQWFNSTEDGEQFLSRARTFFNRFATLLLSVPVYATHLYYRLCRSLSA
jgi:hypothetical protein